MISVLFNYLLESSFCLFLFIAAYRLLIVNLTHFSWIRFYLISSGILSLILPLIIIPVQWQFKSIFTGSFTDTLVSPAKQIDFHSVHDSIVKTTSLNSEPSWQFHLSYVALIIYLSGVLYRAYLFAMNLKNIHTFIKKNSKIKEENYWLVNFKSEMPAFSFFNYIFLNNNYKNLTPDELQIIKNHEIMHMKHYHTLDILFVELVSIMFWFNPLLNYLKKSLREIHEYSVDEKIAGTSESKKKYAYLLLNLASDSQTFNLATCFAGEHTKKRIVMMAKPRTSPKRKLMFFILIPLTAILLVSFSCSKTPNALSFGKNNSGSISPAANLIQLEKYSGTYLPSEDDTMLRPMDIVLLHNKLYRFIEESGKPENKMIELQFVATNKFSYMDESDRSIEFIFDDSRNEVKGCVLTRPDGIYGLLKQK